MRTSPVKPWLFGLTDLVLGAPVAPLGAADWAAMINAGVDVAAKVIPVVADAAKKKPKKAKSAAPAPVSTYVAPPPAAGLPTWAPFAGAAVLAVVGLVVLTRRPAAPVYGPALPPPGYVPAPARNPRRRR